MVAGAVEVTSTDSAHFCLAQLPVNSYLESYLNIAQSGILTPGTFKVRKNEKSRSTFTNVFIVQFAACYGTGGFGENRKCRRNRLD